MRFMMIVKANKDSEAGVLPTEEQLAEMGMYNEELVKAGVLLSGEGLQASSKGARVRYSGAKRTIIDGPFTETKELIAGFWLIQVRSKEEALEWLRRISIPRSRMTSATTSCASCSYPVIRCCLPRRGLRSRFACSEV